MQGIRVGMQRTKMEMRGIRMGMRIITVEMRGIRVGMRVYKYLTGILQGFF